MIDEIECNSHTQVDDIRASGPQHNTTLTGLQTSQSGVQSSGRTVERRGERSLCVAGGVTDR